MRKLSFSICDIVRPRSALRVVTCFQGRYWGPRINASIDVFYPYNKLAYKSTYQIFTSFRVGRNEKYFRSPHALRQTSKIRTNAPTLPQGDLELQNELANANSPSLLDLCSTITTLWCLRAMYNYNTLTYEPSATAQNQLGIAGYLGEFASQQGLEEFMLLFCADDVRANFTVEQVHGGGNDQSDPGVEVRIIHNPWGCHDCK